MKKNPKTTTAVARVIGPVPSDDASYTLWKVRLKVPRFPFYLDSSTLFASKADADKEAEKWKGRKVVVRVTK